MRKYSSAKKEKLANVLIYFAENIPNLSKTKALKLLYLLEELYVKKYNLPLLDIDFEVWQAGPVNRETYIELSDSPLVLRGYITREVDGENVTIIPSRAFCDDEFSDNEIKMMDFIIEHFRDKTAKQLVDYVHRPGSAWFRAAEKAGLLPLFESKVINSSDEKIDFEYFCEEGWGVEMYREQKIFNSLL